jgi:hypothetical protein
MGEMGEVESAWREIFCLGIKYPDFPRVIIWCVLVGGCIGMAFVGKWG